MFFCEVRMNGATFISTSVSYSYANRTNDPSTTNTATFYVETTGANEYYEVMCSQNGSGASITSIAGESWTVAEKADNSGGGGGGTSFDQNGNSFGALAIIGTTDNNGLRIITNNSAALEFTAAGAATLYNGLTINTGNLALNSNDITGVDNITATTFTGNGSGLTTLNASNVSSGTLADARLSSNVSLLNAAQTFTALKTFNSGLVVGNTASATAGAIRWTGSDFEGYDGLSWVSLTGGGGGGGSNVTTIIKTSSETVNNSTTLQNDDTLKFPVGASEVWTFRFVLQATSSTVADLKFAVTAPTGAVCEVSYLDTETAESNAQYGCGATITNITGNGTDDVYEITGTVTNGTTAGDVQLQWAQNTAEATNTIVYSGSYVNAYPQSIYTAPPTTVFQQGGEHLWGNSCFRYRR